MLSKTLSLPAARPGVRFLAIACAAIALVGGLLALGSAPASAAEPEAIAEDACAPIDLGTLGGGTDRLEAEGRWTGEDCDSAFRADSDAHTYRFKVAEGGRIRITLTSADADSYLSLMGEDGGRLADNDDGATFLNARIELDLTPGTYLAEATTAGGRARGPGDFSLAVSRVAGCAPTHLGTLEPGAELKASDTWTLETCGSRFVASHPAHGYSFDLPQDGRVRIDLVSETGDPVLSLISPTKGVIGANDDGGGQYNSRIDQFLPSGRYLIEATTYRARESVHLLTDFTLTINSVASGSFRLKGEALDVPDVVTVGVPFDINYRVGNISGTDLPDAYSSRVWTYSRNAGWDITRHIPSGGERWQAGDSYHTSAGTASETSARIAQLTTFTLTPYRPGESWIVLGISTYDERRADGGRTEIAYQMIERELLVLSAVPIDPALKVAVGGADYWVTAPVGDGGIVRARVFNAASIGASVPADLQAKAVYAAGVRVRVLDDVFERPGLADLAADAEPYAVSLSGPSSSALLAAFGEQYEAALATTALRETLLAGEAVNPSAVEDLALHAAGKAARQYASLAASWTALQERVAGGEPLSFAEALALQAEIAYAERILAPVIAAGDIVTMARESEAGWDDPAAGLAAARLARLARCDASDAAAEAGLPALDAELRAALPLFGLAVDAALCGAAGVDAVNAGFAGILPIGDPTAVLRALAPEPAPGPPPDPHQLRIVARLGEDGRVEHGVEFADGELALPDVRFIPADATPGRWYLTGDVEVGETAIGQVRARRLDDGRTELAFRDANGAVLTPSVRFTPADAPAGVWFRSSEIEVMAE